MRLSFDLFDQPYPPRVTAIGRPRSLTEAQVDWILAYLADRPTAYLDEVCLVVYDEFDIDVAPVTIWNKLNERKWSRKVVKAFAAQRSDRLRADWRTRCLHWPVDKLCMVDESGANERTGYRKRGWSPVGQSCIELRALRKGERWSVLPALTVRGYLQQPLIIQGGVNKEAFVWWLVNIVIPQLEYGSILVMDNASIHHNLDIDDLLESRGMRIEYLPPYSPDLNPIENTFQVLKSWIQQNHWRQEFCASFRDFLEVGCREAISSDMSAYFRHCHYSV
jgi:transposase